VTWAIPDWGRARDDVEDLPIRCRVCGQERPSDLIDVLKHAHELGGVRVGCNVQHCNDRLECSAGAASVCYLPNIPRAPIDITAEDVEQAKRVEGFEP
jgi:hypothetical protein